MLDVFNSSAFDTVSLTAAINKLPSVPGRLGQLNIFKPKGVRTTTAVIEEKNGKLSLIPTSARGTMPNASSSRTRKARNFTIPHIPHNAAVMAEDVQDVRAFGSENQLETVASIVNERMGELKQDHEVTWEYHRAGAIQGVVYDADTTSVIYNWFTEFGIVEQTEDFTSAAGEAREAVIGAKRKIEDALGLTYNATGEVRCLCSETWFDAFTGHADVAEAYARWRDGDFLRTDNRSGFRIWGVTFEEYRANIGSEKFITEGEARMVPIGVPDLFQQINAPADFIEAANTIGKPMYAKQERMRFDVGVELHTQSNPLFICTRPQALVKMTTS